jgi:hypothetical protein
VKFAEHLFGRAPLATFPDEAKYGRFGPRDASELTGDLAGGFDTARLRGDRPPIAASKAEIPDEVVQSIPSRSSCSSIGVQPVPPPPGTSDAPPSGFDPRAFVVPMHTPPPNG